MVAKLTLTETDLSELLPQIGVPTLLVWGDSDARSPLRVAGQFQEAIPDTELVVIEGAGHLGRLERPDQVNDALREFCRANSPRALGAVPNDHHGLAPAGFPPTVPLPS